MQSPERGPETWGSHLSRARSWRAWTLPDLSVTLPAADNSQGRPLSGYWFPQLECGPLTREHRSCHGIQGSEEYRVHAATLPSLQLSRPASLPIPGVKDPRPQVMQRPPHLWQHPSWRRLWGGNGGLVKSKGLPGAPSQHGEQQGSNPAL